VYIPEQEYVRIIAHAPKYHYTKESANMKHFYARGEDGRYFFIDDKGKKYWADEAAFNQAKS
jgi:hypothetical protein